VQRRTQARSWTAAQRYADLLENPGQWRAASGVPAGQRERLLGEGSFRARPSATEESPHPQVDPHWAATQRFVRDLASVAAMDLAGATPAGWAVGRRRSSVGFNMDNIVDHQQTLNPQTSEVRKQEREVQQRPSSAPPQWPEHEKVYRILASRFTKSVPEPTCFTHACSRADRESRPAGV
jgi:hypothetical protein